MPKMMPYDFDQLNILLNFLNAYIMKAYPILTKIPSEIEALRTEVVKLVPKQYRQEQNFDIDINEAQDAVYQTAYGVYTASISKSADIRRIFKMVQGTFQKPALLPDVDFRNTPSTPRTPSTLSEVSGNETKQESHDDEEVAKRMKIE